MISISHRGDFIKNVVESKNFKKYLEIGIEHDPKSPYRLLNLIDKHAIDIDASTGAKYVMTSDDFFYKLANNQLEGLNNNYKWNAIFIDANHNAEYVYRDLINSLKYLEDDGIIFLHDVLPIGYERTLEVPTSYMNCHIPVMNCDAWKVFHYVLKHRQDLHACSVPEAQAGLGIITKCKENNRKLLNNNINMFFQYSQIQDNFVKYMNVIHPQNILNWLENPTYNF